MMGTVPEQPMDLETTWSHHRAVPKLLVGMGAVFKLYWNNGKRH